MKANSIITICSKCGTSKAPLKKYRVKSGEMRICTNWAKHKETGEPLCIYCYEKLNAPDLLQARLKRNGIKSHRKRIAFGIKRITLKQNPRIGVCNWCRAVVPFDCGITHMHHEKYDSNNPLAYMIEICQSCHGKVTWQTSSSKTTEPIYNYQTRRFAGRRRKAV